MRTETRFVPGGKAKSHKVGLRTARESVCTLVVDELHWRNYRRWCRRWGLTPRVPTQRFGGRNYVTVPVNTNGLDDLARQTWAVILDQRVANIMGEHGASVEPQTHGSRRHLPRKPANPSTLDADRERRRVRLAVGGTDAEANGSPGNRVDRPQTGLRLTAAGHLVREIPELGIVRRSAVPLAPARPQRPSTVTGQRNVAAEFAARDKLADHTPACSPSPSVGGQACELPCVHEQPDWVDGYCGRPPTDHVLQAILAWQWGS